MGKMIAYTHGRRDEKGWGFWRWSVLAFSAVFLASSAGIVIATASQTPISAPFMADRRVLIEYVVPTVTPGPTPVYQPQGPSQSYPVFYSEPVIISRGPAVKDVSRVHVGPSEFYMVVGTVAPGAQLRVVGRDESGEWLAVIFPPNSTLRAWLPADKVEGVRDIEALELEPVRLLP